MVIFLRFWSKNQKQENNNEYRQDYLWNLTNNITNYNPWLHYLPYEDEENVSQFTCCINHNEVFKPELWYDIYDKYNIYALKVVGENRKTESHTNKTYHLHSYTPRDLKIWTPITREYP